MYSPPAIGSLRHKRVKIPLDLIGGIALRGHFRKSAAADWTQTLAGSYIRIGAAAAVAKLSQPLDIISDMDKNTGRQQRLVPKTGPSPPEPPEQPGKISKSVKACERCRGMRKRVRTYPFF